MQQQNKEKFCPILYLKENAGQNDFKCWGPNCALWIINPDYERDTDAPQYKFIQRGYCALSLLALKKKI